MAETSPVGEITERSSSFREITWKINYIFSYTSEVGYKIRSPPFHFAGVNCNLSVCPNGNKDSSDEVIVSLFLRMVEWKHESPPVICEIGLKSNDGDLVKSNMAEKNLKNSAFMTCTFKKSEITEEKGLLGPDDSITIFCKLTISENHRKKIGFQTDPQVKTVSGEWTFPDTVSSVDVIVYPTDACVQTEQRCMGVTKILQDLEKLLESEDDTDATIKVQEKEFKVHRGILGTRTPVFAAMFKHDMAEKNSGKVPIVDCEPEIFKDFLHYVYTGTVNRLSCDNAFGLYKLSDKYQVEDLKEECLDCLKSILSVDTFCDILALSLKHNEQELLKLATELFCQKMNEVIVTVKWQSFMCENPTYANELLIKRVQYEVNRHA